MSTLGLRSLSRDQIFDTINRGRVNATTTKHLLFSLDFLSIVSLLQSNYLDIVW